MNGKKIMLTGASGFVGSHLADRLIKDGNEVWAFDFVDLDKANNLREVRDNPNFHYVKGDIKNPADVEAFYQPDADMIYHLASVVGIKNYVEDPLNLVDVVVLGTRYFLGLAMKHKTKFIFTSTSEVYGKNPAIPWNEDADRVLGATSVNRWSYSSSKAVCEHMIYASGVPFTIVRFFNVYGPRQNPIFVVSQTIKKIMSGEPPILYDNGAMTRCFTYIDDIIDGLILCAEKDEAIGQAINLGNNVETTIEHVVKAALSLSGTGLSYVDLDTTQHYGKTYEDIQRRVPMVEKAKYLLNWEAKTQVDEGLSKIIEWAKTNEWWWV